MAERDPSRWYCVIDHEIPDDYPNNGLAVGVVMDHEQVTVSTGDLIRPPDTGRLEARKRR